MGAWGAGSFENDSALDWLDSFCDDSGAGIAPIVEALTAIAELTSADYLEVDEASDAIAAAELIAALQGRPPLHLPDCATAWLNAQHVIIDPGLIVLALGVVDRVKANSELQDLWSESGGPDSEWHAVIADLEMRLGK